jgi:hypothetical protein
MRTTALLVFAGALALAACSQQPSTPGGTAALPPAASMPPLAPTELATYLAGRNFTYSENGTVTETFLADGTGEWRRPSGRSGPFQWTVDAAGTFCRIYAPIPASESGKAWEGGTWCGTATRVAEGLQYTDQKHGAAGVLKEVVP